MAPFVRMADVMDVTRMATMLRSLHPTRGWTVPPRQARPKERADNLVAGTSRKFGRIPQKKYGVPDLGRTPRKIGKKRLSGATRSVTPSFDARIEKLDTLIQVVVVDDRTLRAARGGAFGVVTPVSGRRFDRDAGTAWTPDGLSLGRIRSLASRVWDARPGVPGRSDTDNADLDTITTPRALADAARDSLLARALLAEARNLQGAESDRTRSELLEVMQSVGLDPVPHATVAAAERLARHRDALVLSGAYTFEALAELRGDDGGGSATRTWVSRKRRTNELFTVQYRDSVLVPAFQIRMGAPIAQLREPLTVLVDAGFQGWELWSWFTTPSGYLSGRAPIDILDEDSAAVARAAGQFVDVGV